MSNSLIVPEGEAGGPQPAQPPKVADLAAPEPDVAPEPVQIYDKEYVDSLKNENAKWRQRTHQYEQAFEGYGEADRTQMLQYLQDVLAANGGDEAAISRLQAVGAWEAPTTAEAPPEPEYVTKAEFDAMLRERDTRMEQAANLGYLHSEARKLGYEPDSIEYNVLVNIANKLDPNELQGATPLASAHEQLQAHYRQKWDAFMENKVMDGRQSLQLPPTGTAPVQPTTPPKDHQEARERAYQRMLNG